MRAIRSLCITSLILIGLAGVLSWLTMAWIDSPVPFSARFALAWIASGSGVIGGTIIVGSAPNSDKFGTPELISELFSELASILGFTAFVLFVIGGVIYGGASTGGHFYGVVYVTFSVAPLVGVAISFFTNLLLVVDDSWTGDSQAGDVQSLREVG